MKAIVQDRYGGLEVLALREVERPRVADDEVLVRVHAASVHADVWHVVTGRPLVLRLMGGGLRRPKQPIPGTDVAGRVEAVGARVTRFRPGDEVFGECVGGFQWQNGGAYAEYAAVRERGLALKPAGVSFEQAASVPTSGCIALQALLDEGRLQSGFRVLINGAAGGVGSVALQAARARGAVVTGVEHPDQFEVLRTLGADHVIDYTREDFVQGDVRYDLIIDVASTRAFSACRAALTPEGIYVRIGHDGYRDPGWLGSLPPMLGLGLRAFFTRQLPRPTLKLSELPTRLELLRELLASGQLTPLIHRTYPLAEAAQALRDLVAGRARGRLVLSLAA